MCNSVRAVFVGVLFTHTVSSWLEVFLQATETCPYYEKNTTCQNLKNAENSNCSSSTAFGPTLATMTKLLAGWAASLTHMSAGFPATAVCRLSNLCSGQPRSRILSGLQIVVLFAVLFGACEEYLCIHVGFLPSARHATVCFHFFA